MSDAMRHMTTNQIATTISNAELPAKFVQAPPFLFGLFVPPPRWPPRRHTVATFIRAAWLPIAIVVGVVSLCVGLFVVLMVILPLLLPLLLLMLPIALPLLYLYHRRKTETNGAKVPKEGFTRNVKKLSALSFSSISRRSDLGRGSIQTDASMPRS